MSLFRFALYFLPENLHPPPNSKVCARDAPLQPGFPSLSPLILPVPIVPFNKLWESKS